MSSHIVDGQFQSDKYPTCPAGKVPLSVNDPSAQALLWEYAQRRRPVDAEFADDLESALVAAGYRTLGYKVHNAESYATMARADLAGGHMTDEQVAFQTAMLMRGDLNHEAVLCTAKDRIRWLSTQLGGASDVIATLQADNARLRAAIEPFALEANRWEDINPGAAETYPVKGQRLTVGDLRRARGAVSL